MVSSDGQVAGSLESPLTLADVARGLKLRIDAVPRLWVTGEVQRLNRTGAGTFVTLADDSASSRRPASLTLRVSEQSLAALARRPDRGDQVVALVSLAFWPSSGQVGGQVVEMHLAGDGAILERIEALRRLLHAQGLFDPARKRALPRVPRVVGLVVGRESAAEADVVSRCRERFEFVQFAVRYAVMQGPECPRQVAAAVAELDALEDVDVIVVARGGGSLSDLAGFSDEGLLRAVAACATPVVSAIGHEIDRPLLDEVADARAGTPTQAAALVVPDLSGELRGLDDASRRLVAALGATWSRAWQDLDSVASRPVLADPLTLVEQRAAAVDLAGQRTARAIRSRLELASVGVDAVAAALAALSPESTLQRGYAAVRRVDRQPLQSASTPPGTGLEVLLADGVLFAETVEPPG